MIKVLSLNESEKWDDIVHSFRLYDVYWLSGYAKAFQIHGDGIPLLLYYEGHGQDEGVRGINVVFKRDIADNPFLSRKINSGEYFDIKSPYGYGGWLIEGNNTEQIFLDYERWAVNNHIVSEFIRFHPVINNHVKCKDNYNIIQHGDVVTMDLQSPDIIWNNLSSKNRNVIRKAIKNNVKVYNGRYPEIFQEFRKLYNITMNKDRAKAYYYFEPEFYDSILNDLPENAQIFYAIKDGVIIAASIILCANRMMNYHLSGGLLEYSHLGGTNLILYQAALWGNANGYKTLYLGGGVGAGNDGLLKFKKSFYKNELFSFYTGNKIFMSEIYNALVIYRGDGIENSEYFPEYRG